MNDKFLPVGVLRKLYSDMALIRHFEDKLVLLAQEKSRVVGMQILANGQEAVAAGIVNALEPDDVIVSNHRSHGHLLAKGADPQKLMAEIMCKATGVNKGKAGTLHLAVPEINAIMTSTIVGASPPLAMGAAFAQQYLDRSNITTVFFGDGAAAEGSVHEAMNMASLWKLPVLFVCENNCWAGAQHLREHSCVENIARRADAYDMPGTTVDGNDVLAVYNTASNMADHCRKGKGPAFLETRTYRMRGHGEHDPCHYMDPAELEKWGLLCPLKTFRKYLEEHQVLPTDQINDIDRKAALIVEEAVIFGDESPFPAAADALNDLWIEEENRH